MLFVVPALERPYDRGTRIGERRLRDFGTECFEKRRQLGLSRQTVSRAARISRKTYRRIERGQLRSLSFVSAARVASVLGLDLFVRTYPGGEPIGDAPQTGKLNRLLEEVGPPLSYRMEVDLPRTADFPEQRAWDCVIYGHGERTTIDLDMRLTDFQAQTRRLNGKIRDDPSEHVLYCIADTAAKRAVLDGVIALLPQLPRLRTSDVLRALRAGRHPPTGIVLL